MSRVILSVLGVPIDVLTMREAVVRIAGWARERQSRVVYFCNAHSVVTANTDADFLRAVRQADMTAPDGAPVAWMQRRLGAVVQHRIAGPDLMLEYCGHAAAVGEPIFLYGNTPQTLETLQARLLQRWPSLRIAGAIAPPFRTLTAAEDQAVVDHVNASGAATLWVSLGCPKQELWIAEHAGRIRAVMLGVGAAFDLHAGRVPRAPEWMQKRGLEWLHRLAHEPRRLGRRYLVTNVAFIFGAARQLWLSPTSR